MKPGPKQKLVSSQASASSPDFYAKGTSMPTKDASVSAILKDLEEGGVVLPATLPFKSIQLSEKYRKGQARGRHWKHLKQILQAENYHLYPIDGPNYINIEAPPSIYPPKKYCDISGFEAPYTDPRTKLHFADTDVFKQIRALPHEYVQGYLALRNAQVVLK